MADIIADMRRRAAAICASSSAAIRPGVEGVWREAARAVT
jgi:hypothetical protein